MPATSTDFSAWLALITNGANLPENWNFEHVEESASRDAPRKRVGMMPFMAMDLLVNDRYWEGQTQRCARHDIDALIWMLPWVWSQFDDGEQVNQNLSKWQARKWDECYQAKSVYLAFQCVETIPFLPSWSNEEPIGIRLILWLMEERHMRSFIGRHARLRAGVTGAELERSDGVVITDFWKQIEAVAAQYPHLAWITEYVPVAKTEP